MNGMYGNNFCVVCVVCKLCMVCLSIYFGLFERVPEKMSYSPCPTIKLFTIPSDFSFMYILHSFLSPFFRVCIDLLILFVCFVLFLQLRYFTYSSEGSLIRGEYLVQEG